MKSIALLVAIAALTACAQTSTSPESTASPTAAEPTGAPEPDAARNGTAPTAPMAAPSDTPPQTAAMDADYVGRWTGVEGMVLVVAPKPGGGVRLDMQWDLDHTGTFDGSVTAEGLRFMREGVAETAVRTNGDATGLKYLAGKTDCLTVKPGEGYCRD